MILIDTSIIAAYHNRRDQDHLKAKELLERIDSQQRFITDYIFDETVTFTRSRGGKEKAKTTGRSLLEGDIRMIRVGDELFAKAWRIFEKHDRFSFTDCTTIAAAEIFHIKKIATFDQGFKALAGIEVIDC